MAVVINPNVHTDSELDRHAFLSRVSGVKAVRTNRNMYDEGLTVYIHSVESFNYYRHLKDAICKGDFCGLDGQYRVRHFGIDISDPLLLWFKRCNLDLIYRQVVCWLTTLFSFSPDKRHIMEEQIYPPVLDEIRTLYRHFFSEKEPFSHDDEQEKLDNIYREACLYYYNSTPPIILDHPGTLQFDPLVIETWEVQGIFDVRIGRFWFHESDWERVIKRQVKDNMLGAESSREYWTKWKHQFTTYDSHGMHIYQLYDNESTGGYIYLIREVGTSNYKIGYTNVDVQKRRSSLQTGNSTELEVFGHFPCASASTERVLHNLFSDCRLQGEWFLLTEFQVNNILSEQWRRENSIF